MARSPAALVGFALVGLGAANIMPVMFGAASSLPAAFAAVAGLLLLTAVSARRVRG